MPDSYLTPPKLAKRFGVKSDKVITWINSGELRAVNVAATPGGRSRWRIPIDAIAEFEARRSARPPVKRATPRRRKQLNVIQFFK